MSYMTAEGLMRLNSIEYEVKISSLGKQYACMMPAQQTLRAGL
jgi:hypothetical protein